VTSNLNQLRLCLFGNLRCNVFCFFVFEGGSQYFGFDHLSCVQLLGDFVYYLGCCSLFSDMHCWSLGAERTLYSPLHFRCYHGFFLLFSGIRVCPPQFKHVITMWGSLLCCIRMRQFTPGKIKLLHFLQMSRLYSVGSRSWVLIAIFRAIWT